MVRAAETTPRRGRRGRRMSRNADLDGVLLAALEADARMSLAVLAEKVGLSKTPTWARVRSLEARGLISGYRAEIDPDALGLAINAFIHVTIRSTQYQEFERAVVAHPSVLECHTTAGDADYLVHVLVPNVERLDTLLRLEISRMPGVERISSTIGMKTIKRRGRIMDCLRAPGTAGRR